MNKMYVDKIPADTNVQPTNSSLYTAFSEERPRLDNILPPLLYRAYTFVECGLTITNFTPWGLSTFVLK